MEQEKDDAVDAAEANVAYLVKFETPMISRIWRANQTSREKAGRMVAKQHVSDEMRSLS